jgi:hypothetical protein
VNLTLGRMEMPLWDSRSTFGPQRNGEELHPRYQTQLPCYFVARQSGDSESRGAPVLHRRKGSEGPTRSDERRAISVVKLREIVSASCHARRRD